MEKYQIEPVFLTLAKGLSSPIPNSIVEKVGIDNLKRFVLLAIKVVDEGSDLFKSKNDRKSLIFEFLDLIPLASDGAYLADKMPIILNEVRDLDEDEVKEIVSFLIKEIPNIGKLDTPTQRTLISNIITAAFAVYQVAISIKDLRK